MFYNSKRRWHIAIKKEEEGEGGGNEQTSHNLESFKLKKPQYGYNMQIFVGKTR